MVTGRIEARHFYFSDTIQWLTDQEDWAGLECFIVVQLRRKLMASAGAKNDISKKMQRSPKRGNQKTVGPKPWATTDNC